jgi:hypothetical protein
MRRVLQLAFEQRVPHVDFVVKRGNIGGNRLAQSVGFVLVEDSHGLNRWRFYRV